MIDGAALLDEVLGELKRFVVFPSEAAAVAVALWIVASHVLPAFEHAPRLVVNSPEKRCGKTRLLDLIAALCHRPVSSADATASAIFRVIGKNQEHPPTLIIDEADTKFGTKRAAEANEDLRRLINAGYERGRPALRCDGPQNDPREFPTFAMVAMGGIGKMPETITDRAVNITMARRKPGEEVASFRSRRDGPPLGLLRDRIAVWAAQHVEALTGADPETPVEDRAADTWYPMIAVADEAAGRWPELARSACRDLCEQAAKDDEASSIRILLLKDIRDVFSKAGADFLPSAVLVRHLRAVPESPWDEDDLTYHRLAKHLEYHNIESGSNGKARGYRRAAFAAAFESYLAPAQ